MVARKSTPIALQNSIAGLRDQISALETEQSALQGELRRLRRRKQTWEVYEAVIAASDRLLALAEKITRLYSRLSSDIDRLRAIEARERAAVPSPKRAPSPRTSRERALERERERKLAARRERDRQRSAESRARAKAKKKADAERAARLEAARLAQEEADRAARAEAERRAAAEAQVLAERERQRKATKAEKEKQRRKQKKIDAEFAKSPEQRLEKIYDERPLHEVQPLKGVNFTRAYGKLPPLESVDWFKVFTNVEDHFIDVWGIGKRLGSKTRNTNERLIAGLKPAVLLEILNADVAIRNVNKQLERLPRLVRHTFANDQEAEIARSYTGVELLYPEGFKPFAWIFVPDPDAPYFARIVNGVLEIEQPVSKIREAFVPFTPTQFLDPHRVSDEVVTRFPDAMAAFLRAGAFGIVRLKGKPFGRDMGGGADDVRDSLFSAIVEMQTRYSPGGEMGDQCDPDNPNSRHWKNWMTGVVVFRAKEEKDFLGYIDRYNKIMEKRRADRKEADKERRAQNKAR